MIEKYTLDELKILAEDIDLTEVKEIENFIKICESQEYAKNLYLKGLKRIYLKTIQELEELEISEADLEFVKNQNFKINPFYRHCRLKIYLTALES